MEQSIRKRKGNNKTLKCGFVHTDTMFFIVEISSRPSHNQKKNIFLNTKNLYEIIPFYPHMQTHQVPCPYHKNLRIL